MDLLRIRTVLGRLRDLLKLAGVRVIADAHAQAQGLEVIAQDVFFLGCGAFVHAEQARVLALLNEVGAADIGRQHGLFDQAVRFVAHTRDNFFYAATLVANDLCFGGLEVHGTAHRTRSQQRFVNVLQVHQVGDALLALGRFWPARVP